LTLIGGKAAIKSKSDQLSYHVVSLALSIACFVDWAAAAPELAQSVNAVAISNPNPPMARRQTLPLMPQSALRHPIKNNEKTNADMSPSL
jgi:hypothetical protein